MWPPRPTRESSVINGVWQSCATNGVVCGVECRSNPGSHWRCPDDRGSTTRPFHYPTPGLPLPAVLPSIEYPIISSCPLPKSYVLPPSPCPPQISSSRSRTAMSTRRSTLSTLSVTRTRSLFRPTPKSASSTRHCIQSLRAKKCKTLSSNSMLFAILTVARLGLESRRAATSRPQTTSSRQPQLSSTLSRRSASPSESIAQGSLSSIRRG